MMGSSAAASGGDGPASAPSPLRRRALGVLGARLLATSLLLGGTLVLTPGGSSFTTGALLWLIATAFGTTIAFAIALQRGASIVLVGGAQVALDLGLVTGLVYLTGGAHSGFGSLYAAVVLVAALLLGPRATLGVAAAALALYLALALGVVTGWFAPPLDQPLVGFVVSTDELSAAVLRTSVGLLVVAGLAGALAERLSLARVEVDRATEEARGFQRFAEDVVRSIDAGLATVDGEGRIVTLNSQGAKMLGGDPDTFVARPARDCLPVADGDGKTRTEGTAHRLDGTSFPVALTRTPLLDATGSAKGSLVLFQDLSELAMLREKAEHAERLAVLGRVAAGLAHEIRNPLGSISGSVELVRDAGTLGAEDRRLLDLVLEEVARLNELLGTILSVGRPSSPERALIDVARIVEDVVEVARSKALVPIELEADATATAFVDEAQFRQVLWNLLRNALQFSPRGKPVTVRVRKTGDQVVLSVVDRGPGINATDREHIFDMFFTKRTHGVGVGLALVKQIVDAHGGRIDIETGEGTGTVFRVTFAAS